MIKKKKKNRERHTPAPCEHARVLYQNDPQGYDVYLMDRLSISDSGEIFYFCESTEI